MLNSMSMVFHRSKNKKNKKKCGISLLEHKMSYKYDKFDEHGISLNTQ